MAGLNDSVVSAAGRVLSEHGFRGLTLDRVAAAADISRATLHRHGMTIAALTGAMVRDATAEYRDAMWPVLTDPAPARTRLERALRTLCEVAERHLALLLAVSAQGDSVFHESDADGDEVGTQAIFIGPLERLLRDGVLDGTLRSADPHRDATLLFNVVGWSYMHLRARHHWQAEQAADDLISLALRGVAAPGEAPTTGQRRTE